MKRLFVDTNVFLRFLTVDDQGQADRAEALLLAARAGEVELVTGPPVLFEVAWTLRSAYKVPRARCLEILASLLSLDGLTVTDHALVLDAIDRARQAGEDFADAYVAASAEALGAEGVATFNIRDFERLGAQVYAWPAP